MTSEDYKKEFLKSARIVINLGVFVFTFSILWLLQDGIMPDLFEANSETRLIDSTVVQPDYIPMASLDSADIKDGIHVPSGLIVDEGCQEVLVTCGACHSLDLVTQNRATREGWKEIIVWMQETQKLWDLGEQEVIILDYLAKNYAPENTGRRKNLELVEWYNLN